MSDTVELGEYKKANRAFSKLHECPDIFLPILETDCGSSMKHVECHSTGGNNNFNNGSAPSKCLAQEWTCTIPSMPSVILPSAVRQHVCCDSQLEGEQHNLLLSLCQSRHFHMSQCEIQWCLNEWCIPLKGDAALVHVGSLLSVTRTPHGTKPLLFLFIWNPLSTISTVLSYLIWHKATGNSTWRKIHFTCIVWSVFILLHYVSMANGSFTQKKNMLICVI